MEIVRQLETSPIKTNRSAADEDADQRRLDIKGGIHLQRNIVAVLLTIRKCY